MVSSQMATRDARSVSCVVSEAVVSEAAHREGVGVIAQPFLRNQYPKTRLFAPCPRSNENGELNG